MPMPQIVRNFLRQRAADRVVKVGKRLRKLYAYRAGLDEAFWPGEVAYVDTQIEQMERHRSKLLDYLKETA